MHKKCLRLRHRLRLYVSGKFLRHLFLYILFLIGCLWLFDKGYHTNEHIYSQLEKDEDELEGRSIRLFVQSSPHLVAVEVNGRSVYNKDQTSLNARGVHVIILNHVTGCLMASNVFDTTSKGEDVLMVEFMKKIKKERILIFSVMDDVSMSLSTHARSYLQGYGSKLVKYLQYRDTWVFVSANGNLIAEDMQENDSGEESWALPTVIDTEIHLESHDTTVCSDWSDLKDDVMERRKRFCQRYEGFDKICDCDNPDPIDITSPTLSAGSITSKLPISVVAGNRPFYLFRMLNGLLSTPGVNRQMITVYIDGYPRIVKDVVDLFGIKSVNHEPACQYSCRISEHVHMTMKETFDKYPSADYMIILEEDLDVSQDLMDYFSQLIPVLSSDDSVYCISAWNDQGYSHVVNDSALLYRVETMPGLGWVLKRSIFEELHKKWPSTDRQYDWDNWMREPAIRKGRECIIPDISRTFHFGSKGVHINPRFQGTYFESHAFNNKSGIKFDFAKVTKDEYEKEMHKLIRNAKTLDTADPCSHDLIPPDSRDHTYVIYIQQKDQSDYGTWTHIARCFGIWDIDGRGVHNNMWNFWKDGNRMFIVGTYSPYFKYKLKSVQAYEAPEHLKRTLNRASPN